jgi:hypothetical protein
VLSHDCMILLTIMKVVLGVALLCAPFLKSFGLRRDGKYVAWHPQGSRSGFWLVYPLTVIYILANLGVFVLSWVPANLQDSFPTASKVVPSYAGPIAGVACIGAGAVFWLWDRQILRRLLYETVKTQEQIVGLDIYVYFKVWYFSVQRRVLISTYPNSASLPRHLGKGSYLSWRLSSKQLDRFGQGSLGLEILDSPSKQAKQKFELPCRFQSLSSMLRIKDERSFYSSFFAPKMRYMNGQVILCEGSSR